MVHVFRFCGIKARADVQHLGFVSKWQSGDTWQPLDAAQAEQRQVLGKVAVAPQFAAVRA